MSYKITITQDKITKTKSGNEWRVIGTEEVECNPQFADHPKTRIADKYGYTPVIETERTQSCEIFSQTVDALDLQAVIRAINGI